MVNESVVNECLVKLKRDGEFGGVPVEEWVPPPWVDVDPSQAATGDVWVAGGCPAGLRVLWRAVGSV